MEKKTIGKFISALRRANGMTQRELGERLFVSDKTISRWERDECTPELSLIPAIAEIFGVTTDELLRGERNSFDESLDTAPKPSIKADKQFKAMLNNRIKRFKNMTLISIGISIIGFIACMIANLGFAKGLIGFCLCLGFVVISEICQICFTITARLTDTDDEGAYADKINVANTKIMKATIVISYINAGLIFASLPLVTEINGANYGLAFDTFLECAFFYSIIGLCASFVIYTMIIQRVLIKYGLLIIDKEHLDSLAKGRKFLTKMLIIAFSVFLVLFIVLTVFDNIGPARLAKKEVFDSPEQFKSFVEGQYDNWLKDAHTYYDENGNLIIQEKPIDPDFTYPNKVYKEITDDNGSVICEYYYNPTLYYRISFTGGSDNKMPVTIITQQSIELARNTLSDIESVITYFIAFDFIICAVIYLVFEAQRRKSIK